MRATRKLFACGKANAKDDDSTTALIVPSSNGHVKDVGQLLIHEEVDVNSNKLAGDTCVTVAETRKH